MEQTANGLYCAGKHYKLYNAETHSTSAAQNSGALEH